MADLMMKFRCVARAFSLTDSGGSSSSSNNNNLFFLSLSLSPIVLLLFDFPICRLKVEGETTIYYFQCGPSFFSFPFFCFRPRLAVDDDDEKFLFGFF